MGGDGMTAASLPTHRDEAWRYSDIDAVASAWPLPAPDSIIVPAGGDFHRALVQDECAIRRIEMSLGKHAVAALHILNLGGDFGGTALDTTVPQSPCLPPGTPVPGPGQPQLQLTTTI